MTGSEIIYQVTCNLFVPEDTGESVTYSVEYSGVIKLDTYCTGYAGGWR